MASLLPIPQQKRTRPNRHPFDRTTGHSSTPFSGRVVVEVDKTFKKASGLDIGRARHRAAAGLGGSGVPSDQRRRGLDGPSSGGRPSVRNRPEIRAGLQAFKGGLELLEVL